MRNYSWLMVIVSAMAVIPQPARATVESQASVLSLLIEPGAREIGMGKAGVASARGALATFYNPALLAGQTHRQMEATVFRWLPGLANDIFYAHFAYSSPWEGWGNLGIAMTFLDLGSQVHTDEWGNILGTFDSFQTIFGISYASTIGNGWNAGLTFKVIIDQLAPFGGAGEKGKGVGRTVGMDMGLTYVTERWTLGAALRNYGPKIAYIDADQASPIPININLGGMYEVMQSEFNDIILTFDVYKSLVHPDGSWITAPFKALGDDKKQEKWDHDNNPDTEDKQRFTGETNWKTELTDMDIHAGAEWVYADLFAFRGGYFKDWDGKRASWTVGMGVMLGISNYNLHVDMSLTPNFELNDRNPRITMTLDF